MDTKNDPASITGSDGTAIKLSPTQEKDANIMATNDSSVVSKRAVEALYYPEPHYLRYFVKKRKPRAPLISRGYWLRMKAIEHVVLQFLQSANPKRKIIINLGAGYDTLSFQIIRNQPQFCQNATFVDIDYPELMQKKCEKIQQTDDILKLLQVKDSPAKSSSIMLDSDLYIAAGCDLNDADALSRVLTATFKSPSCTFLFFAEVSICYMEAAKSNAIIELAARAGDSRFCLLEQFMPRGHNYPFTRTMLSHFRKVKSPLQSVNLYDSLSKQEHRFRDAGWNYVGARSLWQLWSEPMFLSSEERMQLNLIEPFDEWEDFALFASHYFLLVASSSELPFLPYISSQYLFELKNAIQDHPPRESAQDELESNYNESLRFQSRICDVSTSQFAANKNTAVKAARLPSRRFGALFETQPAVYSVHGGYVDGGRETGRTNTTLSFSSRGTCTLTAPLPPKTIGPRMCHTITRLESGYDYLLVGGRTSPSNPLADSWLRAGGVWQQVASLPIPLYRHAAIYVKTEGHGHGVLVFGGRTNDNSASNRWFFWSRCTEWIELACSDVSLTPRFGASLSSIPLNNSSGLLSGGMTEDGVVVSETYHWTLESTPTGLRIILSIFSYTGVDEFERFGASLTAAPDGYYLVGGISVHGIPNEGQDIAWRSFANGPQYKWKGIENLESLVSSMILVGHHTVYNGQLAIFGGGAVCFSFGAYVNPSAVLVSKVDTSKASDDSSDHSERWVSIDSVPEDSQLHSRMTKDAAAMRTAKGPVNVSSPVFLGIPVALIDDKHTFQQQVQLTEALPFVMSEVYLGECSEIWTPAYLLSQIGPDRKVTVHRASSNQMSFQPKSRNFTYVTCPFKEFISSIEGGGREYFRALSYDERDTPANFHQDFISIANDFVLPPQLDLVRERMHSSVLRISGPVAMWLHYDVMANVLCQIRGTKTLLLFPPADIKFLDIPAGSSSSNLNVFAPGSFAKEPLIHTHPHRVRLSPGQVLFIPPLWLHAAEPKDGISIAINIFFKDLETGYAAGRDTYGNRDLQAYEEGRKDIKKIASRFRNLPRSMVQFYLQRLAMEMEDYAE